MLNKIFKKDELKLLWPFYISTFLVFALSGLSSYFVLYFLSIGLSISQIAFIESASFFSIFLFDIMTGAIADAHGRKFSIILSLILMGSFSLIMPYLKNYFFIIGISVISGIARTLSTGADEAWIISNLKSEKKTRLISKYFSKYSSIANLGALISALLAVFIVTNLGMKYLWTFQGVGLIFGALILLT